MPIALYVHLTDTQRTQRQTLRRDSALQSRERDRAEMFLLADQGWNVPQLTSRLDRCETSLRRWIRQFEVEGVQAMRRMGARCRRTA